MGRNALISNHFRFLEFALGQDNGTLEGLVNLVQLQFGWVQWKMSICLLASLISCFYEQ